MMKQHGGKTKLLQLRAKMMIKDVSDFPPFSLNFPPFPSIFPPCLSTVLHFLSIFLHFPSIFLHFPPFSSTYA